MKKNGERKNTQRQKQQDLKASLERPLSKSISKNASQVQSKRSSTKEQVFEDTKSQKSKQSSVSPSKSSRPPSKGGKQPLEESKLKKSNLKKPSEDLNLINTLNPPIEGIKPQNLKQITQKNTKQNINPTKPIQNEEKVRCYNCGKSNLEYPILFTCNHTTCLECLVKSLLLSQFKSIENTTTAVFSCKCHMGTVEISFDELISKIEEMNKPRLPGKCRKHNTEGIKYCLDCELWLCQKCIDIHSEFNAMHSLEERAHPIHQVCEEHGESTKFYCQICKKEICSLCVIKNAKHYEHSYIRLEDFEILTNEIKMKFKYKTFEELCEHLKEIESKLGEELDEKVKNVNNMFDDVKKMIEDAQNEYNRIMEEKKNSTLSVIEIIKQCFNNFYFELNKKEQNYYTLDYLNRIIEILTINAFYPNTDELITIQNEIKKFKSKNPFMFQINNRENPYPFILPNLSSFKKTSLSTTFLLKPKKEVKKSSSISNLEDTVYSMVKLSNGNSFAVAVGSSIHIYEDIDTSTTPIKLIGHQKTVLCLCEVNSNQLISGSEDKTIKIWNINNKSCEGTITGNYERVDSIVHLTENLIAAGTRNNIRVYDIKSKEEKFFLFGHEKGVCSIIQINPTMIITGSYDNTIKIWDLNEKKCEYTLFGHDQPVFVLLLLKDGRLASGSGSWEKSIKIWNTKEKSCECTLVGHKREVRALKQLTNGLLISGSIDNTVRVWNIKKKECLQTLIAHFDVILSLCVLNDNRFISGGRDKELIVWKY